MKFLRSLSIILIIFSLFVADSLATKEHSQIFHYINTKNWDQAEKLAREAKDKVVLKIVLSQKYLDSNCKSNKFASVMHFLQKNPAWPQYKKIAEKAESYLNYNTDPKLIVEWFTTHKPATEDGYKFHALAAARLIQEPAKLIPVIKKGWIYGGFTKEEENKYYANFNKYLTELDHIKRIEEHLWYADIEEAKRSMHRVGSSWKKIFEAEIAAIQKNSNADKLFANIPKTNYTPGLLYQYLKYKKNDEVKGYLTNLFLKATTDPEHSRDWWKLQNYYAREFLAKKDYISAYKIVNVPLSTELEDRAEAEFFSGWLALSFLQNKEKAQKHFEKFLTYVKFPISVARGKYWLGRTHEAKGELAKARDLYTAASKYGFTFYGQLSSIELKEQKINLPPRPVAAIHHRKAIDNNEIIQAARLLIKYGKPDLAHIYAKAAVALAKNPGEILLIAEMIKANTSPYYMVEIAKTAAQHNVFIKDYAYPTPYNLLNKPVEAALIYSIIRQESVFNQYALSTANAMGLMQLIKSTACLTAKKVNMKCDIGKLTRDKQYNIKLGTYNLHYVLNETNGSYILAISSYNAAGHKVKGWTKTFGHPQEMKNVRKVVDWIESIPFYETRNYVQRVLEALQVYRTVLTKDNTLKLKQDLLR